MQSRPFTYLFYLQYLGLRYSGWQKQTGVRTIQGTIEKALRFILGHEDFTILGASRTDSGVSCNGGAFELFLKHEIPSELLDTLNGILPSDIRLLKVQSVSLDFNIIQDVAWKEYHYHLAFGEKFHPFVAGNLTFFQGKPDLELMESGARVFVGSHDFRQFCSIDKVTDNYVREIMDSHISKHPMAGVGYIPDNALTYTVKGNGFLRYQIRIMVGALIDLSLGKLNLKEIKNVLNAGEIKPISIAAPANGLVLEKIEFKNKG